MRAVAERNVFEVRPGDVEVVGSFESGRVAVCGTEEQHHCVASVELSTEHLTIAQGITRRHLHGLLVPEDLVACRRKEVGALAEQRELIGVVE